MSSLPLRAVLLLLVGLACARDAAEPEPPEPPPPLPPPAPLFDRVVFLRAHMVGSSRIYGLWTTKTDGSDLRVLRDSLHYPSKAAVSPDGLTVVFEDWDTLYTMRSDGKELRSINTGLWRTQIPVWSPDGAWLYYSGWLGPNDWPQIYRSRPDGSERVQITSGIPASWHPALSRDGRYLAYTRNYTTRTPTWLVIRDLETGHEETVSDSAFTGQFGQWAPDNRTMLFLDGNPQRPNQWAILRFDLGTKSYEFFLDSQGNRNASYSPDGLTLLYGTGDLWLADSNGGNARPILADSAQNFEAYWTPAHP